MARGNSSAPSVSPAAAKLPAHCSDPAAAELLRQSMEAGIDPYAAFATPCPAGIVADPALGAAIAAAPAEWETYQVGTTCEEEQDRLPGWLIVNRTLGRGAIAWGDPPLWTEAGSALEVLARYLTCTMLPPGE